MIINNFLKWHFFYFLIFLLVVAIFNKKHEDQIKIFLVDQKFPEVHSTTLHI